jgi:hypothetical protein
VIQLPDVPLPAAALGSLAQWQSQVDALAHYADRVDAAQRLFMQRNTQRNKTFAAVRRTLTLMCSGAQRCGYCEDSIADEVDHIWPKNLYPELVFAWHNYLYACGRCNGHKNGQFAVFFPRARRPVEVSRPRGAPVRPPRGGEPALIDPRHENPMEFLMIDLRGTFLLEPVARKGTKSYERADYTRRILRLNAREYLPVARCNAYASYKARLIEYISLRDQGATRAQLERSAQGIQREMHPTVWKEMQRQHSLHPQLKELFREAPEALHW